MTKCDLIQQIMKLNRSAREDFLADFSVTELREYFDRLLWLRKRRGPNLLQPESWPEILKLLEPRCPLGIN